MTHYLAVFLVIIFVFILGSASHESDIYRQCKNYGHAGNTMIFTAPIKCQPMDDNNE